MIFYMFTKLAQAAGRVSKYEETQHKGFHFVKKNFFVCELVWED